MNLIQLLFYLAAFTAIYLLHGLVKKLKTRIEDLEYGSIKPIVFKTPHPPVKPEKTALGKFNPPKPKTISPNEQKMKEIIEGVFEI